MNASGEVLILLSPGIRLNKSPFFLFYKIKKSVMMFAMRYPLTKLRVRGIFTARQCLEKMRKHVEDEPGVITAACMDQARKGHGYLLVDDVIRPQTIQKLHALGYGCERKGVSYCVYWDAEE